MTTEAILRRYNQRLVKNNIDLLNGNIVSLRLLLAELKIIKLSDSAFRSHDYIRKHKKYRV